MGGSGDRRAFRGSPAPLSRALAWLICGAVLVALAQSGCHRSSGGDPPLVINEVVSNTNTAALSAGVLRDVDGNPLLDDAGEPVDWIEIFNPNPVSVSLTNYTVSDDRGEPDRFRFPPGVVIPPGGFVVVRCDGQPERGPLHAEFRLRNDGETVFLFSGGGRHLVDQKGYGNIEPNVSVGRFPDGGEPGGRDSAYGVIYLPTPGMPNKPVGVKLPRFQGAPELQPSGGPEPFQVTMIVLEDEEILDAILTLQDLGECGDEAEVPGDPVESDLFFATPLGEARDLRRDFRGNDFEGTSRRLALTFQFEGVNFADGTLLGLRLVATNRVGSNAREERQVVGGVESTLVINEYQPRNLTTLVFQEVINVNGENLGPLTPDWLELFNFGPEPIDLTDYALVGKGKLDAISAGQTPDFIWRFGDIPQDPVIQPGEFRLILCDDDRPPFFKLYRLEPGAGPPLFSTDFQLSSDQLDLVALIDPCGVVVDRADFDFSQEEGGRLPPDVSLGRFPDAAGGDPDVPIVCLNPSGDEPITDERIFLLPGCRFDCATPGAPNLIVCDIAPRIDEIVWINPRCPAPNRAADIVSFVSIDRDSFAIDSPGDPSYELEFTYRIIAPGGDETSVTLTRADGLELEPLTEIDRVCLRPRTVSGAETSRLRVSIPPQPAGTLVVVSVRVRDLALLSLVQSGEVEDPTLGDWVELSEQTSPGSTLRFLSGFDPDRIPLRFNEVLPVNSSILADLYPAEIRSDPAFAPPEFVELYNTADVAFDASGMYLTDDDAACPDFVRQPKKSRIPDGTVIPGKGYLLVLLVDESELNTGPALGSLADRTILVDGMGLASCREKLYLVASEVDGHCFVDTICWDCDVATPGDGACVPPIEDVSIGWLPDNDPDVRVEPLLVQLDEPTPGEPNCPLETVQVLEDSVVHSVLGASRPLGCIAPTDTVRIEGNAFIGIRQWLLGRPSQGLEVAEIELERDGATETFALEVSRQLAAPPGVAEPTLCQALLKFSFLVTPPHPDVVRYTIRLRDVAGSEAVVGPFSFGTRVSRPDIAINEVMAVNTSTFPDEQDRFVPWIELYNGTGEAFDFGGRFLTDTLNLPRQWRIPDIPAATVPAGGFLVVFADGDTENPDDLHSSLTIQPTGVHRLYLLDRIDEGHCVLDVFQYDFTGLPDDTSIGRLPDGEGDPGELPCPSPGAPNGQCPGTFIRGDVNFSGRVNILDAIFHLQVFFFDPGGLLACEDAFDVDDDGAISQADGVFMVRSVFGLDRRIPDPYPSAGEDPTPDELGCVRPE